MDTNRDTLYFADVMNCRVRAVDLATQTITTIVGGGNGEIGDGRPATEATLSTHPMRLSLDSHGHIYIADANHNRIRRIDAQTKIITTLAGHGEESFGGDDGLATEGGLASPHAARPDRHGNVYIADTLNHRIRKVCSDTGIITTFAGNGQDGFSGDEMPATEAGISGPIAVTIDGEDNLYIADRWNHRIRRVDAATGIITTAVGRGSEGMLTDGATALEATFMTLRDVLFGPSGQLYIVDGDSNRIGRLDLNTGHIEIVAGNGTPGFSGDGGPATDAQIDHPYSIAFDNDDNLYIFDTQNSRIRRVDAQSGIISTLAGNGQPGFSGDGGPATAASIGCGD